MARGRINSVQTLGAVDGPGVRFVVFMQGCNLRCAYCHNPETWDTKGGIEMTAGELFEKIKRYSPYFGKTGGVTISGGEPLRQGAFVLELLKLCKNAGVHAAVDTSGSVITSESLEIAAKADLLLLDIKMTDDERYRKYIGCGMYNVLKFLKAADGACTETWLRQVILPGVNDSENDVRALCDLADRYKCVKKVELLPFRKLCIEKYRAAGLRFPLEDMPEPAGEKMKELERIVAARGLA